MTYTVYWIPNPPREAFKVEVATPADGARLLTTLAGYDLYLGDDLIWGNAGGLLDGEDDWFNDEGEDVWEAFEEDPTP